jgi:hypothetical protein
MPIAQLDDLAWIFGLFTLHLIVPCPSMLLLRLLRHGCCAVAAGLTAQPPTALSRPMHWGLAGGPVMG